MTGPRQNRRTLGIVAGLIAMSAVGTTALAAKQDNSVIFAFDQTPPNVDPYFNNNQLIGVIVAAQIWDTLIYRNPETGAYEPGLATAWRWIDDRTLELDLRQGVRFHNGAEFDADDVVFTLNFVSRPENKAVNVALVRWIDHAEKLGKYRLRIVAKEPFPAAPVYLSAPSFVIHPHAYYAKVGPKGVNENPIGSGPYRVVEHTPGKSLRLERNASYFRGGPKPEPKIDKVEIRFIPDAQTRVAETVAGGVDLIMRVDPDQADQLKVIPNLQVFSVESTAYFRLTMNTLAATPAPQLQDVRVRKAIMHAIDREAIAKFIVGKGSRVLHAECHPSDFGCIDVNVPRYEYSPRKARQLLAEAGYESGFEIDIYAYRERNQSEAIIGYLGAVGIRARLRFMQLGAIISLARAGKASLVHLGNNPLGDVSHSVSPFHKFSSDDVNRDMAVRDLLLRGDSIIDPNARKDAYAKALVLIHERAYVLPLYSQSTFYVAAKDLVFRAHADNILRFWEMTYR
jgi:peptide/nickel transport system substrate-binding protein